MTLADSATVEQLERLFRSPGLYPKTLDLREGHVRFVLLEESDYGSSSFLDDRLVTGSRTEVVIDLEDLFARCEAKGWPSRPAHFLFHVGHCGSTLLSKLLGGLDGCFSLREPPALLSLASCARYLGYPGFDMSADQWGRLLRLLRSLLTRTYRKADTALIKPTSHANNIMRALLQWSETSRAILLFVDLEPYLASVLRPHLRGETRSFIGDRLHDFIRMTGRRGYSGENLSDAQQAALIWLVQMREFHDLLADDRLRHRVRAVNFDDYLTTPARTLGSLAAFLGSPAPDDAIERILGSETAKSYAKAAEHADGAYERAAMLRAARHELRTEIDEGLAWAEETGRRYAAFGSLLH